MLFPTERTLLKGPETKLLPGWIKPKTFNPRFRFPQPLTENFVLAVEWTVVESLPLPCAFGWKLMKHSTLRRLPEQSKNTIHHRGVPHCGRKSIDLSKLENPLAMESSFFLFSLLYLVCFFLQLLALALYCMQCTFPRVPRVGGEGVDLCLPKRTKPSEPTSRPQHG